MSWKVYEVANTEEEQPIAWECSECGEVVEAKYNYCPTCGFNHKDGKDVAEVVRCRDCVHFKRSKYNNGTKNYCGVIDGFPDGNWYCADGKRREDGLYESLKRGLEEAIAYENGEIECRTETREGGDA